MSANLYCTFCSKDDAGSGHGCISSVHDIESSPTTGSVSPCRIHRIPTVRVCREISEIYLSYGSALIVPHIIGPMFHWSHVSLVQRINGPT